MTHALEGTVSDGPAIARVTPIEAARQRSGSGHHDRARRRRKLRFALIAGATILAMLPWTLRMTEVVAEAPVDAMLGTHLLLTGMTLLKVVMSVASLALVAARLRRRTTGGRRASYFAGTWMMALGVGTIAIHENYLAGTLLFDAGAVLLVAAALGDEALRRDRPSGIPAVPGGVPG